MNLWLLVSQLVGDGSRAFLIVLVVLILTMSSMARVDGEYGAR